MNINFDDDNEEDDIPPTLVDLSLNVEPPHVFPSTITTSNDRTTSRKEPCPLTILSGFLGAGKTTLIQHILQSPNHGKRIAVIENEYGGGADTNSNSNNEKSLSIESLIAQDGLDLLKDDNNNNIANNLLDMIELPNGCVCCTVKDKLVQTLEALIEKRPDLDYILLECSGMANPGPLATTFWLDEALESQLRLDGIVTLVDAKYIQQQLDTTLEAAQQIAYADRIILNKTDLVSSETLLKVTERIRHLNPLADIQMTTYSRVPDLQLILDAHLFDVCNQKWDSERNIDSEEASHSHHDHSHDHTSASTDCQQCSAATHTHTDAISTITLYHEGCIQSLEVLNRWLAELLWPDQDGLLASSSSTNSHEMNIITSTTPHAMSILRLKGIVALPDQPQQYIVQAVYDTWQVQPAQTAIFASDADKVCQLVVIGKHLNEALLRQGFQTILYNK